MLHQAHAIWCTHLVPELEIGTADLAQTLMMASSYLDVTSYLPRIEGVLIVSYGTQAFQPPPQPTHRTSIMSLSDNRSCRLESMQTTRL